MLLFFGDCLEELINVDDNSVDLIFCDLPYAIEKYSAVNCKWNTPIDLNKLWKEIMRVKKINTAIIFTCTTKFGVSLIQSAPKKCPFRYDLVWSKSSPCGFLSAKKMPLRKHEMIYVFYEKLPFYDLSSHKHKFIDKENTKKCETAYGDVNIKPPKTSGSRYDPALPTSVIKENIDEKYKNKGGLYSKISRNGLLKSEPHYEPPLPVSLIEVKSSRGKHSTEKPVELMKWLLKYYSKEDDVVLDPTMGSGSMGVACNEMKRNFIGIEKDEEIFNIAWERINE